MFTKEDILARLKNGDSIDAIADEVSAVLNAANDAFIESKKIDAKKAAKIAIAKQFNDLVIEYAELENPEFADMIAANMAEEDLGSMVDMLDEFFKMFQTMSEMKKSFEKIAPAASLSATLSDDEVLDKFLASLCN
jgi:nitrate/nitrite-specific signal transduction histidine kinase